MGHELHIPPCIREPVHPFHPPPLEKPLRIQIEGPLVSIRKLFPDATWDLGSFHVPPRLPQPVGPLLARLTYETIYGRPVRPGIEGDLIVRDEYLGWIVESRPMQ